MSAHVRSFFNEDHHTQQLITLTISVIVASWLPFLKYMYQVNCLLGSWYCDVKYAYKIY